MKIESELVNITDEDRRRQAIRSLGGYVYQLYQTLIAWLELPEKDILLLEVAEDYAVVAGNVIKQAQIKDIKQSGSVTLRTDGVKALIESHWSKLRVNPQKKIVSVFITTAPPGHEQQMPSLERKSGLEYWNEVANNGAELEPLRNALLEIDLSDHLKEFVKNSSAKDLKAQLIDPIKWIYLSDNLQTVKKSVADSLVYLGRERGVPSIEAERTDDALIGELLRVITTEDRRELTKADLYRIFDKANSTMISRAMLTNILSAFGQQAVGSSLVLSQTSTIYRLDKAPRLPKIASRAELVEHFCEKLTTTGLLWLHGSSGLGKTTLARLIAYSMSGPWLFIDLRRCSLEELRFRLAIANEAIARDHCSGILLDEYSNKSTTLPNLSQFVMEVQSNNVLIIATSSRAPTPAMCRQLTDKQITVEDVPYLSVNDVAELIKQAGGDATIWTKAIYLFSGGHPLLVVARIHELSSLAWPESELYIELDPGMNGSSLDVTAQRNSVILDLKEKLPANDRELLYRLSIALNGFDSELALAIADIEPKIQLPGETFQDLIGPWIEMRGQNSYMVSPLLAASGKSTLSKSQQSFIRKGIIRNLIERQPFPGDQLNQLFLMSFIEQDRLGMAWFTQLIIQNSISNRKQFILIAQHMSILAVCTLEHPLFASDLFVSALLRIAQCLVAIEVEPLKVSAIFVKVIDECKAITDRTLSNSCLTMAMSMTLSNPKLNLAPSLWFTHLLNFNTWLTDAGEYGEPLRNAAKLAGNKRLFPIDQFLFLTQACSLPDVDTLIELFIELDKLDNTKRRYFLDVLDREFAGTRQMVEAPWLKEVKANSLDGRLTAQKYERLAEIAGRWDNPEVAISCICAQTIMLDEHCDNSASALSTINDALKKYGKSQQLLYRQQVILFRQFEHAKSLNVFSKMDLTALETPDQIFSLRYAGICAAQTDDLQNSYKYFEQAASVAFQNKKHYLSMGIRLLAECALVEFMRREYRSSISTLERALRLTEQIDIKKESEKEVCTQILCELVISMRSVWGQSKKPDYKISPGGCSYFGNPLPPSGAEIISWFMPWYQLAEFEAELNVNAGVLQALRARTQDEKCLSLEIMLDQTLIAAACKNGNVADFITLLPNYFGKMTLLVKKGNRASKEDLTSLQNISPTPVLAASWDNSTCYPLFTEAVITFSLFALASGNLAHIPELHSELRKLLPANSGVNRFIDILVDNGNNTQAADLTELIAAYISFCQKNPNSANPEEALNLTYYFWEWLRRSSFKKHIEGLIVNYVFELWRIIITERSFMLTRPMQSGPLIQSVLDSDNNGAIALAKLALAANEATSSQLSVNYVRELNQFLNLP